MPHVFISYSTKDLSYAEILERELEANDYTVWRDKSEIRGGDEWVEKIKDALRNAWALVLIQSPDSEKSDWVQEEIQFSENTHIPVIPILLRGDPWFGFLRKQFLDIRDQKQPIVPDGLYTSLLPYAPPAPIENEIGKDLIHGNSAQRMAVIPKLEAIAWNMKSPRGIAAYKLLENLARDPDEYVRGTAQTAMRRLSGIRQQEASSASLSAAETIRAPIVRPARNNTNTGAIAFIAFGTLVLVVVLVAVMVYLIQRRPQAVSGVATQVPTQVIPTIAPDNTDVPEDSANRAAHIQVLQSDNFDSGSVSDLWETDHPIEVHDGAATLVGQDDYLTYLLRGGIHENMGVLFSFRQVEGDQLYLTLFTGDLSGESNRRWILFPGNLPEWLTQTSVGNTDAGYVVHDHYTLDMGEWYNVLERIDSTGRIYTQVWKPGEDSFILNVNHLIAVDVNDQDWTFAATAKIGTIQIDDYYELEFPEDYQMPDRPLDPASLQ